MPRIVVNLNPSQNSLEGLYTPGDDVIVMCNATDADFDILMPDADSSEDTIFDFIKEDNSINVVNINARANQKIMNEDSQCLTEEADDLRLQAANGGWW